MPSLRFLSLSPILLSSRLLSLLLLSSFFLSPGALFAQRVAQPETSGTAQPNNPPAAPAAPATPTVVTTSTTAAASAPTPAAATAPAADADDIVHMSVFNVQGDGDDGYQSLYTTSGSRLRTPLKDTAASISIFAEQFLNDVGVSSIEEMLAYAGNFEAENEDATNGFNNEDTRRAGNLDNRFRIRGIAASVSTDFGESGIPVDPYNIGNTEIASGANSILFGLGAQGGMLMLTTKRANLRRTSLKVQNVIGTWNNPGKAWDFERLTLDYNLVLMPRTWSLRLLGIYQDGGPKSWRQWQGYHQKRLNPVMTIKPFRHTVIHLAYEKGRVTENTTRNMNSADQITAWLDAGRPIVDGFAGAALPRPDDGISQINAGGANPQFVFVGNNNTLYDFRQAYQSVTNAAYTPVRLPASLSSYYYNTVGPSGIRDQQFERWSATIEQRAGPFNFELAYNHNKTTAIAHSPGGIEAPLRGDPNSHVSTYAWGGAVAVVPDPYSGRLYLEDVWFQHLQNQRNDAIRLTAEVGVSLGKFGRHRIVGLLEHAENETYRNHLNEILVDDNQVAIATPNLPNDSANQLTRRHYVTEGDFSTYHGADWGVPVTGLVIGDRTFHSTYVTANQSASHVKRTVGSAMLALQSHWLQNRLATTFGLRFDDAVFRREQRPARITDPNDPRILNKTKVLNEWAFNGIWDPPLNYHPRTFSAGGVWHATDRLSATMSYSTNRGAPYVDGRTVLPDGNLPGMTTGRTFDYGVILDILGNGKWTLRLTRYDTRQLGDAVVVPGGIVDASNGALGSTNLFDIYDALYYLHPTGQTGTAPSAGWPAGTGPGMGPLSQYQYIVTPPSAAFPNGAPPRYNSGTVNVRSQGYELELTARPAKNIDLRLTFSYTDRDRVDLFPELFAFYNTMIPVWMEMAARNNPATGAPYMVTIPNSGVSVPGGGNTMPLTDYLRLQLYGAEGSVPGKAADFTSVRGGLNNQLYIQSGPLGSRPFKFNITGKYSFRDGLLRGFALGGSVVYSSPNLMPDRNSEAYKQAFEMPPEGAVDLALDPHLYLGARNMIKGNSLTTVNTFFIYKMKPFGGKSNVTLQLNIHNLLNRDIVTVGRVQPDGAVSRVYINSPRSIRLSTTFEF
jgi:outer membrane receptor protein involved in Fe transport